MYYIDSKNNSLFCYDNCLYLRSNIVDLIKEYIVFVLVCIKKKIF